MKFYEVTDQIILTGHLIASNVFAVSRTKWDSLTPDQQVKLQDCSKEFETALSEDTIAQEAELVAFFEGEGLTVYEPDKEAFRNHVLEYFQNSDYSNDWPEGLIDQLNAL
jgi:TRAP-type C4-dicarboxylate transport system substrate-binding protein